MVLVEAVVVILALAAAIVEECSLGSMDHCRMCLTMILFFWLNACVVILYCVTNYYIAIFVGMETMKGVEDTEGEGETPWWCEEGEE